MDNNTLLNEYIFITIFYIIEVLLNITVWIFIINLFTNTIKRKVNRHAFKRSIIINKKNNSSDNSSNNTNESKYKRIYNDVSKAELAQFNTDDIDNLKDFFYNMFLEFEKAYNDLDYNVLKILSTKQLYNNYYTGMSLDLKAGKKRIIRDIEKKNVILFEVDSTIAKQVATMMVEISYFNYVINSKGHVISGDQTKKVTEKFEVSFRKDFEREEVIKCPTCGATLTGNKCNYCRSIIKNVEFKISSIRKIIDEE